MGSHHVDIIEASYTGKPTSKQPGSIGRVDDYGAMVACGDEWIWVRKVKIDGRMTKPVDILK